MPDSTVSEGRTYNIVYDYQLTISHPEEIACETWDEVEIVLARIARLNNGWSITDSENGPELAKGKFRCIERVNR